MSEIILQQTRVSQGTDYYLSFLKKYPDVHALASAREQDVLKTWQGLGYYSRARNLHHTAKEVSAAGGCFPDTYEGLLKLKGIGSYTAAAISSICFGEARPVIDGNVARVLARITGMKQAVNSPEGMRSLEAISERLMEGAVKEGAAPGMHNQAIMEFGALQCVPVNPTCEACPLSEEICLARKQGTTGQIPVKLKKKAPEDRFLYFFVLQQEDGLMIEQRGLEGIWKSLYQFPMAEARSEVTEIGDMLAMLTTIYPEFSAAQYSILDLSPVFRHQLTHRRLHARFIRLESELWPGPLPAGWMHISRDHLRDYPVPKLLENYMDSYKI